MLLFISNGIKAQTVISGVINDYSRVTDVTNPQCAPCDTTIPCLNKVTVNDPGLFATGDKCLIIQMKGAEIDPTNGIGGGDITNIGNAGNYEFFDVKTVVGNDVYPERPLTRVYDAPGLVQLVRVPTYQGDVEVNGELTATPWDPALSIGGVLALFVEGDLTLNADLNVEGLGFKGVVVAVNGGPDNCSINPVDQMMKPAADWDVCPKGNGIVVDDPALNGGRAPRGNGGGGGVSGDSGGGGGSNYGAGGNGGDRWCGQALRAGGIGGHSLIPYLNMNKVFLGGAGGPGFVTSGNSAAAANGGGIIVIKANQINGNNRTINASGTTPSALGTGIDGGGGGGAGGTIVINTTTINGGLDVLINGGDGQDLGTPVLHGPGGGGGGGALLHTLVAFPPAVNVDLTGGVAGVHSGNNSTNSNNGTDGQEGGVVYVEDVIREFNTGLIDITNPTCGQCDGTIEFNNFSATSELTYSIDNGANFTTDPSFIDLCADSFYVQVLDQDGCVFDTIIESKGATGGLPFDLGNDTLVCKGESVEIGIETIPLVQYNWSTGETTSKITITDAGVYTLTVGDGSGCDMTDSMELVIEEYPDVRLPNDTSVCDGEEVTFNSGLNGYKFLWNTGDTTASLSTKIPGTYWMQASSPIGCSDTDSVALTATAPFIELPDDILICDDEFPVEITGKGNNFTSIEWNNGETNLQINVNVSGEYIITAKDDNDCEIKDTIEVVAEVTPIVELPNDTSVCAGEEVTFDSGLNGFKFLWSNGDSVASLTTTVPGLYWLEASTPNHCKTRDTVNLNTTSPSIGLPADIEVCDSEFPVEIKATGNDFDQISWNNGETEETIEVSSSGDYIVTVSDENNCVAKDTINVYSEATPVVILPADTGICLGEELTFTTNYPTLNAVWSTGDKSASIIVNSNGDYWLEVSTPLGCSHRDTVNVNVTSPSLTLPPDTTVCSDELPFNVVAKGNNFLEVLWNDGNTNLQNTIGKGGEYIAVVRDVNNCVAADTMNVYSEEIPDVDLGPDLEFCLGESRSIGVGLDPQLDFTWNFGLSKPIVDVNASGEYILTVSTSHGCAASDTINVKTKEAPFVLLNEDTTLCFDELTSYRLTTASNGTSIFWSTGDTTESILVTTEGEYTVSVSNEVGCTNKTSVRINENCPWSLYVPNAFTPNGDGTNEFFTIKHHNIMDYKLFVFNRWGELIFTSNHKYFHWDGTYKGNLVQEDVYVYKLLFTYDENGKEEHAQKVGTVTVVR